MSLVTHLSVCRFLNNLSSDILVYMFLDKLKKTVVKANNIFQSTEYLQSKGR